jgi:hypothetical protein
LHAFFNMPDVPGVSASQAGAPRGASEEWLSFERRMRKRRLERCLLRANTALEAGVTEDAEAAIKEARELDNGAPELPALERRLAVLQSPAPTQATPRNTSRLIWIAAGLAVVGVSGAFTIRYLALLPTREAIRVARTGDVPLPADRGNLSRAVNRLRVVHETIMAPVMRPRVVLDELRLPPYPAPPIAEAEPQPQTDPVVHAVNRADSPPQPAVPEPRSELRLEPNTPLSAAIEPLSRAVVPPAEPVTVPATRASAPAPAVAEAANVGDESTVVQSVLRRYEAAYSSLDAAAASIVWPGVNRGALARAFDGLASQHVSLGSCDVTVNGPAARAICSGSATWEPKVGGGVRTEARRWDFTLRKNGEAWRIERAIAR